MITSVWQQSLKLRSGGTLELTINIGEVDAVDFFAGPDCELLQGIARAIKQYQTEPKADR